MSTGEKAQKISIGFHGGQVLSARVKPDELSRLRGALGIDWLARDDRGGRHGGRST